MTSIAQHFRSSAEDKVIAAESLSTVRTLVLSGRPLRLIPNDWVRSWEKDPMKVKELCDKGRLGGEEDER